MDVDVVMANLDALQALARGVQSCRTPRGQHVARVNHWDVELVSSLVNELGSSLPSEALSPLLAIRTVFEMAYHRRTPKGQRTARMNHWESEAVARYVAKVKSALQGVNHAA